MNVEEKYIRLCFELAKKAEGLTSPNPIVGAVLVVDDKIIGKGYHTAFGKPHAEIEAINDAIKNGYKHLLKKATLYVNLEPCCHWGKTPPCVDKIIEAGIKKVVCSMIDPNPLVKGKGIKKLQENKIKCVVGVLQEEAKELNRFYVKWVTQKLPYVTIKIASTFDGKIATVKGSSKWISSEKSRQYVWKLRTIYDAVLVGVNTIKIDNPELTSHSVGKNPIRVIVGNISSLLSCYDRYKVFDGKIKTIFFTHDINPYFLPKIENVSFYNFGTKIISYKKILSILAKEYQITSVLVEGGGETIWLLLKENMVDEVLLFLSPKIVGGRNAKTWVEGEGVKFIKNAYNLKIVSIEFIDEDLVIKSKLIHK